MLIDVIGIDVRGAQQLLLEFENHEKRLFDISPYLNTGVFRLLRDVRLFQSAHIDGGTVAWPGGIDIAPETLYAESVPVLDG